MQSESQGQDIKAPDIQVLHQQLVDKVKAAGHITSPRVEEAFRAVPRHLFLPDIAPQEVYQDRPIMTKMIDGQFVSSSSQPTIMAIMLEQLDLQPGQRVLEIGAGTGYNAALMAHIVGETGQVVTIDLDEDIVEAARTHLATAGYERVQVICADGGLGYPDAAPYDRIILTVSASDITPAWREQLQAHGRLLLPLSVRISQLAIAFEPVADANYWQSVSVRPCGFVGLRGAFANDGSMVQLLSDPGRVLLALGTPRPVQAQHILSLLQGHYRDMSAHIELTPMDIYWSLNYWLAIHEPLICDFFASGEAAHSNLLPGLTPPATSNSALHTKRATGLLSDTSLALMYPSFEASTQPAETSASSTSTEMPGQSGQAEQVKRPPTPLLALNVRSYGNDDALAQRLMRCIRAWDAAERPDVQRLHIRAYRRDDMEDKMSENSNQSEREDVLHQAPVLGADDIMIEERWSRFVFNWRL